MFLLRVFVSKNSSMYVCIYVYVCFQKIPQYMFLWWIRSFTSTGEVGASFSLRNFRDVRERFPSVRSSDKSLWIRSYDMGDPRRACLSTAARLRDRSQSYVPIYYVCNIAICIAPVSSSTTEHQFNGDSPLRARGGLGWYGDHRRTTGASAAVMRRHRRYILCKHLHA